jgi:flagellin
MFVNICCIAPVHEEQRFFRRSPDMNSIHTNHAATLSLQNLRAIDAGMADVQNNVSSGLRITEASNNAAYWSIATTMRSDSGAISAVQDALGLGAATVDTAYMGMSDAVDIMAEIKSKLVAAREPGVDQWKINKEIDQLKNQIRSIATSATFSGQNWLQMNSAAQDGPKEVVGSFVRGEAGDVSVKTVTYDMTSVPNTTQVFYLVDDFSSDSGIVTNSAFATDIGTATDWVLFNGKGNPAYTEMTLTGTTPASDIDEMILVVDAMAEKMVSLASTLGALQTRIGMQLEFANTFAKVVEKGIGRLVDADLSADSTRLKALQAQQQLGSQALSIANNSTQTLIKLLQ